jgi:RNA polymerase sigma-70 factor (ECF subfamily)
VLGDFDDDDALVAGLRARDPDAFGALLDRYHGLLQRLARRFVASDAVADEVVGDTWLAVVRGIDGFEGRSSVKTWLVRILSNLASRQGEREARTTPFSSLGPDAIDEWSGYGREAFAPTGEWQGHWARDGAAGTWHSNVADAAERNELRRVVLDASIRLPAAQRQVFVLRDVEGWTAAEVSEALAVSMANQRVLLHRARLTVRAALAGYVGAGDA